MLRPVGGVVGHVEQFKGHRLAHIGRLALTQGALESSGLLAHGPADSHTQSRRVLVDYDHWLESRGLRLADHVVRTWWFVGAIDGDYQGLVDARREYFETRGLTADTHYIASTGIQGGLPERDAKVGMDAYTIAGLQPDQIAETVKTFLA